MYRPTAHGNCSLWARSHRAQHRLQPSLYISAWRCVWNAHQHTIAQHARASTLCVLAFTEGWLACTLERMLLLSTRALEHALRDVECSLQIGHETSDTIWSFARDGTISWMHGLRFLPGEAPARSVEIMCERSRRNMGFHPAMFRPPHRGCSYRTEWDFCWSDECSDLVRAEWGCAARRACETPYAVSMLQARHPLRTAESLAVKFCEKGTGGARFGAPHEHLGAFLSALFPSREESTWRELSCEETVGWYWAEYTEAMLRAVDGGLIDAVYKVEDLSPCQVARLAGFTEGSGSAVVHAPSIEAVVSRCGLEGRGALPSGAVRNQKNRQPSKACLSRLFTWRDS
mmetsp:Transcript_12607/g.29046  ORF Transcript_12607/g.29046 Transcript_12607/m.29046 type:complete len:344 (-) Transcript_12607:914-1945(-)